jgi:hypothetical protein
MEPDCFLFFLLTDALREHSVLNALKVDLKVLKRGSFCEAHSGNTNKQYESSDPLGKTDQI